MRSGVYANVCGEWSRVGGLRQPYVRCAAVEIQIALKWCLMTFRGEFYRRLISEWVISDCNVRGDDVQPQGFVDSNFRDLSEFDAHWFLVALEANHMTETLSVFHTIGHGVKLRIFSHGTSWEALRKTTLSLEPIICVGAVARLIDQYGWPASQLGQCAFPWPFDLVCFDRDRKKELVNCEVKKSHNEVAALMNWMRYFAAIAPLEVTPTNSIKKNAYKKIVGLRKSRPAYFWVLGPEGIGNTYRLVWDRDDTLFQFAPVPERVLAYAAH